MTNINLLPWREQRREQERKEFIVYFIAAIVLAVLLVLIVNYFISIKIDEQSVINGRLETEITEYKKQLVDIKNLRALRQSLIARMKIVQNLQATRTLTVRLFDELIKVLPDGVYVTRMDRTGDKITLFGYTESNSSISLLMHNIESSEWIQIPVLTEIKKSKESTEETPNEFKLSFILKPKTLPA
jgi:type IV pilus assembly protein PilN